MDADFSVELGSPQEEATLELPWDSGNASGPRYLDLKRHPHLLALIEEAVRYPVLCEFLQALNSPDSRFETAKCDVWMTGELADFERAGGAVWKRGSYVDIVFAEVEAEARFSFFRHEELARALVDLLKQGAEICAAAEFIVRRCYYHRRNPDEDDEEINGGGPCGVSRREADLGAGFYLTFYLFGYGRDQDEACQSWEVALHAVENAILQVSRQLPGSHGLTWE